MQFSNTARRGALYAASWQWQHSRGSSNNTRKEQRLRSTMKLDDALAYGTKSQAPAPKKPGKLMNLWRQYGYVALGTYFTIYVTTLTSLFYAFDNDLLSAHSIGLSPEDVIEKVWA
jgi:hypothetical protein